MNRVVRDGLVAVLYSPGFGAGWSTWASSDIREQILFDPGLVDLVENEKWEEAQAYATLKYPEFYAGGLEDLQIKWIPQGTQFQITEHDGYESIETRDSIDWITA